MHPDPSKRPTSFTYGHLELLFLDCSRGGRCLVGIASNKQEAYETDSTDHLFLSASRPHSFSGGQYGRMEKFLVLG
jgi:hypothetical protein